MAREKKSNKQEVQENPDTLPEYQPPIAEKPADNQQALIAFKDLFTISTMDDVLPQIDTILAMSNDGEEGIKKAYGALLALKFLSGQRKKIAAITAELVIAVQNAELWKLLPGDQYETAREFWEAAGLDYSEVQRLITFSRDVKPVLQSVGINPDEYWEETSKLGMQAVQQEIRDIQRQIPLTPGVPIDEETKEVVAEKLLSFKGLPDSQIKPLIAAQKGNDPAKPIEARLTLSIVNGKVRLHGSFDLSLDEIREMARHHAYFVYKLNGGKTDWTTVQTIAEREQLAQDGLTVVDGEQMSNVIESNNDDEFDMDIFGDEDIAAPTPLKRNAPTTLK